jgi:hypothetical protein
MSKSGFRSQPDELRLLLEVVSSNEDEDDEIWDRTLTSANFLLSLVMNWLSID